MHFEFLVEGQAELTALSILIPKILGEYNNPHTWMIHKHQGIGKLPEKFDCTPKIQDRTLLHNFPSKLKAYGNSMSANEIVVLLLDLDNTENCIDYKKRILSILEICDNPPRLLVRFAIEELEAWFLGDPEAIKISFANPKVHVLNSYVQDSICGTWEVLAETVHEGGYSELLTLGKRSRRILEQKRIWASKIAPNMNVDNNTSKSFNCFKDGLLREISK